MASLRLAWVRSCRSVLRSRELLAVISAWGGAGENADSANSSAARKGCRYRDIKHNNTKLVKPNRFTTCSIALLLKNWQVPPGARNLSARARAHSRGRSIVLAGT